jgi:hypothetical protein
MIGLIQQFLAKNSSRINTTMLGLFHTLCQCVFQINLYVYPTSSQRIGNNRVDSLEFAYQKAELRFDNYSIRAIIRDKYILNGHQGRPQRHPF